MFTHPPMLDKSLLPPYPQKNAFFTKNIIEAIRHNTPNITKNWVQLPAESMMCSPQQSDAIAKIFGTYRYLINQPLTNTAPFASILSHLNIVKPILPTLTTVAPLTNNNEAKVLVESRIPKIDLYSVGGNTETLDKLADVVRVIQNPDDYKEMDITMPKGVILSGPPGVGKSFMAEAIAGHLGLPFFSVSAASMQSIWIGGTEENLRKVFESARNAAPCVLCIDEIDAIGQKRFESPNHGGEHYANGIVDQLLTLLSEENPGVIILATTNNYETLDPALVRPGRFDRHIVIPKPNVDDCKHILELHTKNKPLGRSVSLAELAKQCSGYTGAELAALVNEAAINAVRRKSKVIEFDDFDQAITFMKVGVKRKPNPNPLQRAATASHEAAHGLVGHLLKRTPNKISIMQQGEGLGFTENMPHDFDTNLSRQDLLNEICIALAGRAGEELFNRVQVGNYADIEHAKQLATYMVTREGMGSTISGMSAEQNIETILANEKMRAQNLLKENRSQWETVTQALLQNLELKKDDFLNVLNGKSIENKSILNFFNATKKPNEDSTLSIPPKGLPSTQYKNGFFSNNNSQSESNKKSDANNKITKTDDDFPFTLEEVAKAIGVEPKVIRRIKRIQVGQDGCEIVFKPSFKDNDKMNQVSTMLKEADVENMYSPYYSNIMLRDSAELHIWKAGYQDFVKFVKEKNVIESPALPLSIDNERNMDFFWYQP